MQRRVYCAKPPTTIPAIRDTAQKACTAPGPFSLKKMKAGAITTRINNPTIRTGITAVSNLGRLYVRFNEYPLFKKKVPAPIPTAKPTKPKIAFQSPPAKRRIKRKGQPRNMRQPIITKKPRMKRVMGALPPLAWCSPRIKDNKNAPKTRPMISGRIYCTGAARCNPSPPTVSRIKQAIQKPMFAGFPARTKNPAMAPMIKPAIIIARFSCAKPKINPPLKLNPCTVLH